MIKVRKNTNPFEYTPIFKIILLNNIDAQMM